MRSCPGFLWQAFYEGHTNERMEYSFGKEFGGPISLLSSLLLRAEGILSLMQMARTTVAVKKLKERKLPFINIFTNPTMGGVTASFAMLGDIAFAEPGASIGFAGLRVIEQITMSKLPSNFQKADYLLDHGMIDQVVPRKQLKAEIIKVFKLLHPAR